MEENQRAREVARKKEEEEKKQQEQEEAEERKTREELQCKIEARRDEEERLQEERAAQSKLRQQQMERAWKEEQQRLLEDFQQEEERKQEEKRKQEEALAKEAALRLKQLEHEGAKKKLQEMRRMLDLGQGEDIEALKKKMNEAMDNQELLDEITQLLSTRQEITEESIMANIDQSIENMIGELGEKLGLFIKAYASS